MTKKNVERLDEKRRKRKGSSIAEAIRQAKQRVRNLGADEHDEPEGLASGDMKRFLENPEDYEKEDDDERKEGK